MEQNIKRLETLLSHTNAELNRVDSKYRNVGSINSLLMGGFIGILLYCIKYTSGIGLIVGISITSLFMLLNLTSIIFAIYGVWPRKKYTHTAYDLRYIARGNSIKQESFIEKFNERQIKQMIRKNAVELGKKEKIIKICMYLTIFPFSIALVAIIRRQDQVLRSKLQAKKAKKNNR